MTVFAMGSGAFWCAASRLLRLACKLVNTVSRSAMYWGVHRDCGFRSNSGLLSCKLFNKDAANETTKTIFVHLPALYLSRSEGYEALETLNPDTTIPLGACSVML